MGFNNPGQYTYQYRMTGIEEEWIQGSAMQPVRYYLNPGKYRFQLFASRKFDPQAKPMKELVIVIRPPFWKTWWFISLACIASLTVIVLAVQYNTRRRFEKKLQSLENERQMKLERERISRDLHDNLGAYANAVLHNSQLLEKEQAGEKRERLVSDLKFASRDIITSLRETVWALNHEEFSAEDCMLRIRNFIQPLIRYYPNTHFRVSGTAPEQMILHYTKALNLVRIVQEAISNSIKHAHPDNIHICSQPGTGEWVITVADDGKGFDVEAARKSGQGNGLYNMESRALESGFKLNIASTPEGTVITIIL
jgi:signal transduction histidine kinase